ncbi:MAG: hypothetical protein KAX53_02085 [Saprospiraceae bacterium]|jgi:hypothetical protein|nr:hypothetical protein [Saprospiraceae bacterium]MBK7467922.1 hypothetical protein [Saprospiraceae bacterium]MBK9994313.1 hypothetical protein [Saprospiraceae bacterium]MBP8212504.1 hypothetical protein [Saprospiraceae bacterium]
MKKVQLFLFAAIIGLATLISCSKEEAKGTCSDGIKNQDETGIDCGGVCTACKVGTHGKWKSAPVAPILTSFADSIFATFNTNNTYTVDQWKGGTKVVLSGTYTQAKSSVGNIYTIILNQTSPTVLTAEGIFEVASDNKTMKYEVAQTSPAITGVTAPTPAGGIGSTSGGKFGDGNVQNYTRIE